MSFFKLFIIPIVGLFFISVFLKASEFTSASFSTMPSEITLKILKHTLLSVSDQEFDNQGKQLVLVNEQFNDLLNIKKHNYHEIPFIHKFAYKWDSTTDFAADKLKAEEYLYIHRPLKLYFYFRSPKTLWKKAYTDLSILNGDSRDQEKVDYILQHQNDIDFSYTWKDNSGTPHSLLCELYNSNLPLTNIQCNYLDCYQFMKHWTFDYLFSYPAQLTMWINDSNVLDKHKEFFLTYSKNRAEKLISMIEPYASPYFWSTIWFTYTMSSDMFALVLKKFIKEAHLTNWPKNSQGKLLTEQPDQNVFNILYKNTIKNTPIESISDINLGAEYIGYFLNNYIHFPEFFFATLFKTDLVSCDEFITYFQKLGMLDLLLSKKDSQGYLLFDVLVSVADDSKKNKIESFLQAVQKIKELYKNDTAKLILFSKSKVLPIYIKSHQQLITTFLLTNQTVEQALTAFNKTNEPQQLPRNSFITPFSIGLGIGFAVAAISAILLIRMGK